MCFQRLSKTTSRLSCFFLDVFDEPGDVQPVGQRVMEIDEQREQVAISCRLHLAERHERDAVHLRLPAYREAGERQPGEDG